MPNDQTGDVAGEHRTHEEPDGSVRCSCGVRSQRFGTRTRSKQWARDHRAGRPAPLPAPTDRSRT